MPSQNHLPVCITSPCVHLFTTFLDFGWTAEMSGPSHAVLGTGAGAAQTGTALTQGEMRD